MDIYLLRHGHAVATAPSDELRPLSEQGQLEVQKVIQAESAQLADLNAVWVSPYLRAQQTWMITHNSIGTPEQVTTQPAITPFGDIDTVLSMIEAFQGERILLVTHQNFVGSLLNVLCGFEPGRYFMGTANLACVNAEKGMPLSSGLAELQWLRQP